MINIYLLQNIFQEVKIPLQGNQMRETALLVRVDRLHDELVDVGEAIEEKEELYKLDSH